MNIAVLDYVAENIRAGISTEQINKWVDDKPRELGGIPAPLGYEGFPKSVCTSINDEVCHGIPSEDVILKEGDIINVDVSTIYKGYFSDSSRMFIIGKTTPDKEKLVRVAKECVEEGIKAVKPWTFLGDMRMRSTVMQRKTAIASLWISADMALDWNFMKIPLSAM